MGIPFRLVAVIVGVGLTAIAMTPPTRAVEPGVDIAVPRVALTSAGSGGLVFTPAVIRVERGDHVRWRWIAGSHTTTSGNACAANGVWNSPLSSVATTFTRQFLEAPGTLPFFCQPHCGVMTGQVVVTTPILLAVTESPGAIDLAWSGGAAPYRVHRSASPLFGAGTAVLTPAGGTNTMGFTDASGDIPEVGGAFFYLVMNQF